jgi:hypothetical protein
MLACGVKLGCNEVERGAENVVYHATTVCIVVLEPPSVDDALATALVTCTSGGDYVIPDGSTRNGDRVWTGGGL